jgi:hypothetical protein
MGLLPGAVLKLIDATVMQFERWRGSTPYGFDGICRKKYELIADVHNRLFKLELCRLRNREDV